MLAALDDESKSALLLERSYDRELAALDARIPDDELLPGIYLSVYGDTFFGASANTSYADTLRLGGIRGRGFANVAEQRIAQRPRCREIGDVPGVQDVEAAIGHDKPLAGHPQLLTPRGDVGERNDFVPKIHWVECCGRGRSLASHVAVAAVSDRRLFRNHQVRRWEHRRYSSQQSSVCRNGLADS